MTRGTFGTAENVRTCEAGLKTKAQEAGEAVKHLAKQSSLFKCHNVIDFKMQLVAFIDIHSFHGTHGKEVLNACLKQFEEFEIRTRSDNGFDHFET